MTAVSDLVNLAGLLDEAKCFEMVRQHRWPQGVRCPVAPVRRLSATATTRPSRIGNAIFARRAGGVSMI